MKNVTIYTDGACSGNPGPGGWAAILRYGAYEKAISGGESETTNNRMELLGAINALQLLKEPCAVDLYTDSQYLANAINQAERLEGPGLAPQGRAFEKPRPLADARCAAFDARRHLPLGQGPRRKRIQ